MYLQLVIIALVVISNASPSSSSSVIPQKTPQIVPAQKAILITGTTSGIGHHLLHTLSTNHPNASVYCFNRNTSKSISIISKITNQTGNKNLHHVTCDLSSIPSINSSIQSLPPTLNFDIIVHNSGIVSTPSQTMYVNHIGASLLQRLINGRIKGGGGRVVYVNSRSHLRSRGVSLASQLSGSLKCSGIFDLSVLRPLRSLLAYQDSKLASMMDMYDASNYWGGEGRGVDVVAVHPGVVRTGIWRSLPSWVNWITGFFMLDVSEGSGYVYKAMFDKDVVNGGYYSKGVLTPFNKRVKDEGERDRVRRWTEGIWRKGGIEIP